MVRKVIEVIGAEIRQEQFQLKMAGSEAVSVVIGEGEQVAIVGENGSGKSLLAGLLMGRYPLKSGRICYDFCNEESKLVSDNIKQITFRDSYGATSDKDYYYQQRWNSCDRDGQPKVCDKLPKTQNLELQAELFEMFSIEAMLDKEMILLSSGELRRFHLVSTLLASPRVLILDNPFIGLDLATRNQLGELLQRIVLKGDLQLIMLLSRAEDVPDYVTHIIKISNKCVEPKISLSEYRSVVVDDHKNRLSDELKASIKALQSTKNEDYENVVEFNNVSVRYGNYTILKDLSFRVKRGEKWAIRGRNGSGKSTLLSLISADNPQRYACDIRLFDKGRNAGQSIWQIKQRIGYVSPEMHRAYMVNASCLDIVGSGLYDTVGLHSNLNDEQKEACRFWMKVFGINELEQRNFMQVSSGEQRMVLLARAFVKNPELLILDEPLHGLDSQNCKRVLDIVDTFTAKQGKSLLYVTHYDSELPNLITNNLILG